MFADTRAYSGLAVNDMHPSATRTATPVADRAIAIAW